MKKLFILAAAIIALASCSKNEPEATVVPTREIQFASAAQTRAAMTVVDVDYLEDNGFAVYGYAGEVEIFNNTLVTYASKNALGTATTWAPKDQADVKYWSSGVTYNFSAYAPKDKAEFAFTSAGVRSITSYTNDGVTDLVVADKANSFSLTTNADGTTTATPVSLNFSHMLSRVKFTFANAFADKDVVVKVTGVQLVAAEKGSASIDNTTNKPTWTVTGTKALSYNQIDDLSYGGNDETEYMTIIPETEAKVYELYCTIVAEADGKQIATIEYNAENPIELPSTTFVAGQGYDFKANINVDQVGEIYPIEFTVTVTDWVEPANETEIEF